MIRRRLALLFLPTLLILLLAAGFAWLLRSESGAQWLWQRLAAAVPGELRTQQLRGDLQSGLVFEQLSYRDAGLALAADTVALRLDLDLLKCFWQGAAYEIFHSLPGAGPVFAPRLAQLAAPGLNPEAWGRLAYFLRIILPAQICFLLGS